jgi:hypothetical protein
MFLIQLAVSQKDWDYSVEDVRLLSTPHEVPIEKNWLPFFDGTLKFVYSTRPSGTNLLTLQTQEVAGPMVFTPSWTSEREESEFRGSAPPISFTFLSAQGEEKGWLYMVHRTIMTKPEGFNARSIHIRRYLHRWCFLSSFGPSPSGEREKLTHMSDWFYFRDQNHIEFVSGMTLSEDGKTLVIGLSIRDIMSFLLFLDREDVARTLLPFACPSVPGE